MRNFLKSTLLGLALLAGAASAATVPTIIPLAPGTLPTSFNAPANYDGLFIDLADGNLKTITPAGVVSIVGYSILGVSNTWTAPQTLGTGSSLNASSLLISPIAPTIASACGGGSPSIVTNGTGSMAVTIGTASGSTCVLTLPAAAHGWMCAAADVTTPASNLVQQTGSSTTGATFTNYVRTTGVAGTWTASDVIEISCAAN